MPQSTIQDKPATLPTSILISLSPDQLRAIVKDEITIALDNHSPPVTDEIMTIKEAASYLKIPVNTIYKMCAERTIPYFKPGKANLFYKSELKKWLEGWRK